MPERRQEATEDASHTEKHAAGHVTTWKDSSIKLGPIKNNRDYQKALREIDRLMDARLNSPEGGRLDVLATLAETWEEKRWHIDEPEPVET